MTEKTATELAEELMNDLDEEVVDVDEEELTEQYQQYLEYNVKPESARSTILRDLAETNDMNVSDLLENSGGSGESEFKMVSELTKPDEFVTVEVEVLQLWDNDTDAISQVGLIGDETGRTVFKSWATSEVPLLTEGQAYRLENVATNEFNDEIQISLNSRTEIEMIELDTTTHFSGAIIDVSDNCGLIRRCSEDGCNKKLNEQGECPVHGEVEGEFDLSLTVVVDDGTEARTAYLNRVDTESLTGTTLEEAKSIVEKTLNREKIRRDMMDEVVGKYVEVQGWTNDRGDIIVEDVEDGVSTVDDVDELIVRLDAMESEPEYEQAEVTN